MVASDRATALRLTTEALDQGAGVRGDCGRRDRGHGGDRQQVPAWRDLGARDARSARAMNQATAVLEPLLLGAGIRPDTCVVPGTFQGDLEDIDTNLVAMT